jgi:trans-aconitate methyltransferase
MTRRPRTLRPDYFETMYASDPDPWRFASSPYERFKYATTLAALPKPRYAKVFEVGCSIGVLTTQLASRCDSILAVDAAEVPLTEARSRCASHAHARFERMYVPEQWPRENFDLILLSEIVYYLDARDVARLAERVAEATAPGAAVILVHWIGETDYPLSGDEAAELFIACMKPFAKVDLADRHPEFRLDRLTRV